MSHVWLVHRRLIGAGEGDLAENKANKHLQEAVFDKLWEDTTVRIRSMGVSELMVGQVFPSMFLIHISYAVISFISN